MQPAPTVTNCNIITEDINEDDLRERLVYIANAQYCDLQNFNETHRESDTKQSSVRLSPY
eukprot:snap_masked-scaffold_2-processed-gene-27.38-mRNA-1 protein AED:1.00 eAED:1.00 QI:0/-1/0/0/-1/1/1/0/59